MADAVASTRVRVKRKRRKPPSKAFKVALFWVCWDVVWLVGNILCALQGYVLNAVAASMLAVALVAGAWPTFMRELRRWENE